MAPWEFSSQAVKISRISRICRSSGVAPSILCQDLQDLPGIAISILHLANSASV